MKETGPRPEEAAEQFDDFFERSLRNAMRRVDAPETLAKLLAAAAQTQAERKARSRWLDWFRPSPGGKLLMLGRGPAQAVSAFGAAALVVAALAGSLHLHEEHRHDEAARQATREFDESIRITDQVMEHAREQLSRAGVPLDSEPGSGKQ